MVPAYLRTILKRLGLLLLAYQLTRAFFLFWNWHNYASLPKSQVLLAFVHGLRFDLSAILFTNAVLLLVWLLPSRWLARPWLRRTELAVFAVINWIAIGANVMDAEYVKFIGKRNSFDLLFIREDVERQSLSMLLQYWYLCAGLSVLIALLIWMAPRFRADPRERIASLRFWLTRFAVIALAAVGMRGGFQFKPLHPMHAYFSTSHALGLLTLNTPFNVIKSKPRGNVHRERYFASDKEAVEHLQAMTELTRPPLAVTKDWNVVVILLESFSLEYVGAANDGRGYTPFLDELSRNENAFFFPLSFANARRSIEGLPAVLCGMPALMNEPIITSDFSNNRLDCLPKILGQEGYSTYFLHGAHNGSMHFDTFSKIAGFEHFVGLNEYPRGAPEDLDPNWGVLDEPMLQYAAKLIDEAPKPVMLGIFTLSSHSPYYIPPKHRDKFPKGTLEIHESVGYTDHSVREFFKTAATKPWFNNTIFVITADHTQKSDQSKYGDLIGPWRVPIIFYIPGLKAGQVQTSKSRMVQHIDILPTVTDLLGVKQDERLLLGQSVFDLGHPGRIYNYTHYGYWYMNPEVMIDYTRGGTYRGFEHAGTWSMREIEKNAATEAAFKDLKAIVHYVNQGLLGNSLHNWKDAK